MASCNRLYLYSRSFPSLLYRVLREASSCTGTENFPPQARLLSDLANRKWACNELEGFTSVSCVPVLCHERIQWPRWGLLLQCGSQNKKAYRSQRSLAKNKLSTDSGTKICSFTWTSTLLNILLTCLWWLSFYGRDPLKSLGSRFPRGQNFSILFSTRSTASRTTPGTK